MLLRILLLLDSHPLRARLREILNDSDALISVAGTRGNFWNRLARENSDLILVSRNRIPEPVSKTISQIRELPDRPDIIVFSDREHAEEGAELLAAGCFAVIDQELSDETLRSMLQTIIQRRGEWQSPQWTAERTERRAQLTDFISSSPCMQTFLETARRVVGTISPLLILGETGVGKERLARAIHNESPRAAGPFIAINCGALPETLLESELFGHEEGAFTGATRPRRGYFELAHRGTIFLDEIGEMPPHLQVKLLRVLQEYEIQRIGSEKRVPIDVRIMAASNRNLEEDIDAKRFRRDLYYRLAVVTLTIPPLRERREDIAALARHYIEHFNMRLGREIEGIGEDVLSMLIDYSWPGNVRELINVVERAVLLCSETRITPADLPLSLTNANGFSAGNRPATSQNDTWLPIEDELFEMPWPEARRILLERFERFYLSQLLRETQGRIGATADRAGIQPRSLYEKMRAHGLRKQDFKPDRNGTGDSSASS